MTISQILNRLRHRLWSTTEVLLLVRPANVPLLERVNKVCPGEFRAVTEENIQDCAQFEDASHYVPVYREMLKRGDAVRFGYLDGNCVFRHCMQLSGTFFEDGCVLFAPLLQRKDISTTFFVHHHLVVWDSILAERENCA